MAIKLCSNIDNQNEITREIFKSCWLHLSSFFFFTYQSFVFRVQFFSTFAFFICRLDDRYTELNSLAKFTFVEKFIQLVTFPLLQNFLTCSQLARVTKHMNQGLMMALPADEKFYCSLLWEKSKICVHYRFLMDSSNGVLIIDDNGSFLLKKLQRSVGKEKTYRLYRSKF